MMILFLSPLVLLVVRLGDAGSLLVLDSQQLRSLVLLVCASCAVLVIVQPHNLTTQLREIVYLLNREWRVLRCTAYLLPNIDPVTTLGTRTVVETETRVETPTDSLYIYAYR
eukprot:scpid92064/ scgid11916/ 